MLEKRPLEPVGEECFAFCRLLQNRLFDLRCASIRRPLSPFRGVPPCPCGTNAERLTTSRGCDAEDRQQPFAPGLPPGSPRVHEGPHGEPRACAVFATGCRWDRRAGSARDGGQVFWGRLGRCIRHLDTSSSRNSPERLDPHGPDSLKPPNSTRTTPS